MANIQIKVNTYHFIFLNVDYLSQGDFSSSIHFPENFMMPFLKSLLITHYINWHISFIHSSFEKLLSCLKSLYEYSCNGHGWASVLVIWYMNRVIYMGIESYWFLLSWGTFILMSLESEQVCTPRKYREVFHLFHIFASIAAVDIIDISHCDMYKMESQSNFDLYFPDG